MNDGVVRLLDVQREILAGMRKIFLANWAAFTLMQSQMESLLRRVTEKRSAANRATVRRMEWWLTNFRRARADFQTMVEEVFLRAQKHVEKEKRRSGAHSSPCRPAMV